MKNCLNYEEFMRPEKNFYPRPLWFWNDRPTEKNISEILDYAVEKTAYGGFGILPYNACGLKYLDEEYMQAYELAVKKASECGLKLCLYDEWWFPSGSANGLLKERYPEACARRLDKIEYDVQGEINIELPQGKLMAAVAMDMDSLRIVNLKKHIQCDRLIWNTEGQRVRVMFFVCVLGNWDHVNYLDPKAVEKFISITHDTYYEKFASYFGTVIDSSFYDEPQMYKLEGRMWVDDFNELFIEKYGFEPDELYPALWYDIGEGTASARCMLHGLRSELYSRGFPKIIQEWCNAHKISLTGHVDQEEVINPTGITGDLMKSFEFQDIPGYDEIMFPKRASKIYKIISSAAYNYDKAQVMSECYGAMSKDISMETMYSEVMEQFVKGMTMLVPHAVWLDPSDDKIVYQPELSYRNKRLGEELKPFNEYCARISKLLTGGRHISDIAVIYPIHSLHAEYYFDWGRPYHGGPAPKYLDYQDIGAWLSSSVRKDFTYLHPDVLDNKCTVENGVLTLNNAVNYEKYKVIVLPGSNTVSLRNLLKIREFVKSGGTVILTSRLPEYVAEGGNAQELKAMIREMFDESEETVDYTCKKVGKGFAWWVPHPTPSILNEVLEKTSIDFDVCMNMDKDTDELVTYIHKYKDGRDLYYFVNCNADPISAEISLRGERDLELWEPHISVGSEIRDIEKEHGRTRFKLLLYGTHSCVIVS